MAEEKKKKKKWIQGADMKEGASLPKLRRRELPLLSCRRTYCPIQISTTRKR
jgi:hypothetical protein